MTLQGNLSGFPNNIDFSEENLPMAIAENETMKGEFENESYRPSLTVTVVVLTVIGIVVLTGIVGNILVLVIIATVKSMHTTVNKCLFCLGIADLIILTVLPVQPISQQFTDDMSFLGRNFCMFLNLYDRGAMVCSVLLFLYITVERYIAVCHPVGPRWFCSGRKTYMALAVIWVLALTSSLPYIYISKYEAYKSNNRTIFYCALVTDDSWKVWYDTISSVLTFYFPVPILGYMYIRMMLAVRVSVPRANEQNSRRRISGHRKRGRVVVMLLAVVVVFVVCQLPFTTAILIAHHYPAAFNFGTGQKTFAITWTFRILVYVNSAANPLLYFSTAAKFRRGLKIAFGCCGDNLKSFGRAETYTSYKY